MHQSPPVVGREPPGPPTASPTHPSTRRLILWRFFVGVFILSPGAPDAARRRRSASLHGRRRAPSPSGRPTSSAPRRVELARRPWRRPVRIYIAPPSGHGSGSPHRRLPRDPFDLGSSQPPATSSSPSPRSRAPPSAGSGRAAPRRPAPPRLPPPPRPTAAASSAPPSSGGRPSVGLSPEGTRGKGWAELPRERAKLQFSAPPHGFGSSQHVSREILCRSCFLILSFTKNISGSCRRICTKRTLSLQRDGDARFPLPPCVTVAPTTHSDQRVPSGQIAPPPLFGPPPSSAFPAQRTGHPPPEPRFRLTPLRSFFPTVAHANPDVAASRPTAHSPLLPTLPPPQLHMACSVAAAGAEATALLFRRPAPSSIAGRSRLAVSRRNRHRNLRTGAQPPQKSTPSANYRNRVNIQRDRAGASSDDEHQQNSDDENGLPNIQLEDLVGMIQNTEKNILLLNQARLQALERADKILKEKEALQQKINILEIKLSETVEQSELSSEGKSDAEAQEFDVLKEENMLLKDDINFLKSKLIEITETEESLFELEKERATLDASLRELECAFIAAQSDMLKLGPMQHDAWWERVENLEELLESTANQVEHAALILDGYHDFQDKIDQLEASLGATKISEFCLYFVDLLKKRVKSVEERFQACSREMHSQIELYEHSIVEFNDTLSKLIKESEKKSMEHYAEGMPSEFWSRISLLIDGWSLEKKISSNDAKLLREMAWKRDNRLREAYLSSRGMAERELIDSFLKMALPGTSSGLHIVHIAAEMAPVAKVGGLADVISGLGKALQKKGHLVEIILPKYDCMQHNQINNLKALDVVVQSYFEGNMFANKIWTGTVEGLPVYFIEPQHPGKFFWRAQYYGEHDDFKRFSYFSRVALELLYQSGKKVDIIHCHDWQTAFVAPLYWDVYANLGFNTARICFTCHNFEYQGTAPAQDLAYCGLDVEHLDRPDRMRDNSHGRINVVKGAIVYSNVVTTVSPTYAQEVRSEGGRGLQDTLKIHSKKFVGILNGIDTDTWNPSTDRFLKVQYSANDLYGKSANKESLRKQLKMSSANASQPLVGCITRLVPQKGVHLIRHAIYKTAELGGQFVLLGSSPVPNIQREFEGIADQFQNNNNIRLLLKYDDALSHMIFAASDMFIVPSLFEPCGLTQMIAMRYGSVPVVRKTGGLNDSVFDFDDETIPMELRNGFTFLKADEQGFDSALERAFNYYHRKPEVWKQLVQKDMKIDFSWDTSASQYEDIYQRAAARARAAA